MEERNMTRHKRNMKLQKKVPKYMCKFCLC